MTCRPLFLLLASLVALLATAAPTCAQDQPPPPPPPASSQSLTAPDDWQTYQFADGSFSIEFPGKPEEQLQPVETPMGRIEGRMMIAITASGLFAAQYADYPVSYTTPGEIRTVLDAARDLSIERVKGRLLSEREISYNDYRGREVVVAIEAGTLRTRQYLVGRRMYMLMTISSAAEETAAQKRFFGSFKILKGPEELDRAGSEPVTSGSLLSRLKPPPPEFFRQPTSWREFSPPEGGFRVALPGEPYTQSISINPADERVKLQIWIAKGDEVLCQIVSQGIARAPRDDAERKILFESIRQGLIESAGARIENEAPTTFAGQPGREFKVITSQVTGVGKVILTDRAIYVVAVFSQYRPEESAETARFFNSFRLIEPTGPGRDR